MTRSWDRRLDHICGADGWNHPKARDSFVELALKLTSYGVPPTVALDVLTWAYQAAADNRPPCTDVQDERDRLAASLREEIQWQQEMYGDGKDRVAMGRLIGMKDALQTVLKGDDDT